MRENGMWNRREVGVASCGTYEPECVRRALEDLFDSLGGLDFVSDGMTVALKVNLVSANAPEKAATTHPTVIAELCRMLRARGARVIVGDSSGGLFTPAYMNRVYRMCGLRAAEEAGAELNQNFAVREADFPEGVSARTFMYTAWLDQADCIINVCKLKTHAMLKMTCSVKNLFGTIPGTTKPEYHMRFPQPEAFADMLVDLNEYFRPELSVVDAVDCMEGNGPTSGTPRHMGALLASHSPYALDMACAHLIGLGKQDVQTLEQAFLRHLGPESFEEVQTAGADPERFVISDFQTGIRRQSITFASGRGLAGKIGKSVVDAAFRTQPQVTKAECIGCGKCHNVCPAGAITMVRGKPQIDRGRCIKCFCCQEFCPVGAMKIHHTLTGRILQRLSSGTS